jgi:NosR/NirI family transcriptional regulator, nitrous oxide reductase regulator
MTVRLQRVCGEAVVKRIRLAIVLTLCLLGSAAAAAERFPPPDFEGGYQMPATVWPAASVDDWQAAIALTLALSLAAVFLLRTRSRRAMLLLSLICLGYFGFIRRGCICPIGALHHVVLSISDSAYSIPLATALLFALPLVFALLFGRVFCGGVCPIGAVQDVVLVKPLRIPHGIERALCMLPAMLLGAGVLLTVAGAGFLACELDPAVHLFRLSGSLIAIVYLGSCIGVSMFIGRPFCRFGCPYGVLLNVCGRWSWRRASITPNDCDSCSLCEDACPFNAIEKPTPPDVAEDMARTRGAALRTPLLIGVGLLVGVLAWPLLVRLHPAVTLAETVAAEQRVGAQDTTFATEAWRLSGETWDSLHARAVAAEKIFRVGTPILGAWCGLIVALHLLGAGRAPREDRYRINHARCVACARCFRACPRERTDKEVL